MRHILETKSHAWHEAGLARKLSDRQARRARIQAAVLLPALGVVVALYLMRETVLGAETPVRLAAAGLVLILGSLLARALGQAFGPLMFRRLDPGAAGTIAFLIRLVLLLVAVFAALRIGGVDPRAFIPAAAAVAVLLGLAAQQTIGNLIAGIVVLTAHPFRVGDRIRLQGGDLAGEVEGVVSSLGLLHTVLASGEDSILIPNRTVMNVAIIPLREPAGVNLRARLQPGVTPLDLHNLLVATIDTPMRGEPRVLLEELEDDAPIVRIQATPQEASEGARLASEVLRAIAPETQRVRDRSAAA
ncbi:MAG: mechanosensitive ion channel family protein [Solirubrobacteraceae bacterium]|nr:mechanosensitive ion channel family protein [Solirubrobacteraceae bacterium]